MAINFFASFLNMSISAALVTAAILLVRQIFSKRLPALFSYLLWSIVLFRFMTPFSVPSLFSALGITRVPSQPAGPGNLAVTVQYLEPGEAPLLSSSATGFLFWKLCAWAWLAGALVFLIYGIVSYRRICYRADMAFVIRDCPILSWCSRKTGLHRTPPLYRSDAFPSPVIVGFFHPRIILPGRRDMGDQSRLRHILTHECVHLRRYDHITKVLFSLVLCMHWFNPLAWISCILFDRDVEASCDERSLEILGEKYKADYARSLIDLSTTHRSIFHRRIAFSESSLHLRVMNIVRYRPLTRPKQILVVCLALVIGLVTVTNPIQAPDIYYPRRHAVSRQSVQQLERVITDLNQVLQNGDTAGLLALSLRSDSFYLPLYDGLKDADTGIKSYKLYPQSEDMAYCYLTLENGLGYVATIQQEKLVSFQLRSEFEASQLVDRSDEAVRLIENLHRFGILQQIEAPETLPRPAVAMLCIDEVYRDKLVAGELSPGQIYLEPDAIIQAAEDYFGLKDFSYTFDPELYDTERQAYIYSPDRGDQYDVQVVSLAHHEEASATVTAIVYEDPLHMIPQYQITYMLQKNTDVHS